MMEDECASNTIPVPNVDANILAMVIEFCKKHAESEAEAASDLKTLDSEFANRGQEALYDLITAANFLDVKELLDALCQNVAEMIKGKSVHQIRIQFLGYQLFEILTSNFIWNIWCDRDFD
ncbi:SKP1-like protein 1A [Camellia sinensis]|uniref:SKP1-like protein 1A n=1 Tax=Camellia sinensis TaxID=4442 RepID=UPI00103648B6|nr:SKP1-like protein 1A [Camellia sinensis]